MCIKDTFHYPVMYREVVENCPINAKHILDGTFGHAGHAKHLLQHLPSVESYLALDQDPDVIAEFKTINFEGSSKIQLIHTNFADISSYKNLIKHQLDFILLDLGTSMYQLQNAQRGFSFLKEGPLDMRMNNERGIPLKDWISSATKEEISHILREYGEEKFHYRIAVAISENSRNINSTLDLANCIEQCLPKSYLRQQKIHAATRSFQAFRIMLNQELECLKAALGQFLHHLCVGGRMVVISFHSLEDRIVKTTFREWEREDHPIPGFSGELKVSFGACKPRKVIRPSNLEVVENSASRSARMRVF